MGFHIVLLEPEIPSNTGNIGRTCVATGSSLHLIDPLGFRLNDKLLARAGMDYWQELDVHRYDDWDDFLAQNQEGIRQTGLYFSTTKGKLLYSDADIPNGAYLVFGKESAGIPEEILAPHPESCLRIPMLGETRSLNLSNAVAILLYEALRQNGFPDLKTEGELHRLTFAERAISC